MQRSVGLPFKDYGRDASDELDSIQIEVILTDCKKKRDDSRPVQNRNNVRAFFEIGRAEYFSDLGPSSHRNHCVFGTDYVFKSVGCGGGKREAFG